MPAKAFKPCARCHINLTRETYCETCKPVAQKDEDKWRGSAHERGYTARWYKRSKAFLRRPENQLCAYELPGCTRYAQCTDHQQPPTGPNDPLFWDESNWRPACIHCNSVKGHQYLMTKEERDNDNRI